MSEQPSLWTLARAFNHIALTSFGGGLSAWSREVIVVERHWMQEEEFLSASTISRIMPGANQVNLAVYVGTRLHGGRGAIAAVAGLIACPMGLVLLAGALYLRFRGVPAVQHVLTGMASAAVGLTLSVAWRQGRHVLRSPTAVFLATASLAMAAGWRVSLWLTLLLLGPLGFWWAWRNQSGQFQTALKAGRIGTAGLEGTEPGNADQGSIGREVGRPGRVGDTGYRDFGQRDPVRGDPDRIHPDQIHQSQRNPGQRDPGHRDACQ